MKRLYALPSPARENVSERGVTCQQEISLFLFKTPSIHALPVKCIQQLRGVVAYLTQVNTAYRVTRLYAVKFNCVMNATQWFWFLETFCFYKGCNYLNETNENDVTIFEYWMPIHYDAIEDGLNKNLIFYSLTQKIFLYLQWWHFFFLSFWTPFMLSAKKDTKFDDLLYFTFLEFILVLFFIFYLYISFICSFLFLFFFFSFFFGHGSSYQGLFIRYKCKRIIHTI